MRCRPGRAARLTWADYRVRFAHRRERRALALLLFAPRALLDSSLHAALLLRALGAAPQPLRGLLRRTLLWGHAIYVDDDVELGPGAFLPHPVAIVLGRGTRVGEGVTLLHNVSLGGSGAGPWIGDGARLYTGVVVQGAHAIGAGALVGAGCVVVDDVPDGGRLVRGHGALEHPEPLVPGPRRPVPAPAGSGLRAILAADHAARFGGRPDPGWGRLLGAALRDRPLRVVVVMRLMHHGPRPLWRLWRRVLLLHACDLGVDAQVGAGLSLPCPVGVVIGRRARLGRGVTLHEHATVTPTRLTWEPHPAGRGLSLGDGVAVLAGAGAFGDVTIPSAATVAPRALVTRDVGAVSPTGPPRDPCRAEAHAPPRRVPSPPLRDLLGSDLRRLVDAGAASRARAAVGLPFQAAVLLRLATGPGRRRRRAARTALQVLHHSYVGHDVQVGPGVHLPHPCGIRLGAGARLGAGVTVGDRVSVESGADVPGGGRLAPGTVVAASPDVPPTVTS